MGGSRNLRKEGPVPKVPFLFLLLSLSPCLSSFLLPLELGPLKPARRFGGAPAENEFGAL